MTVKRVWIALLLGAAVWGCQKDTGGTTSPQPALAGLRYFDAVSDTGFMDFRVVDIVTFSPISVRAVFRSGGNPNGIVNGFFSPYYMPVQTGTHTIRVFLDSTDLATTTTKLFDTTVTFTANTHYTFYLYGSARTPPLKAMLTADTIPTIAAGNIAVRVLNLMPALDGTPVAAPSPTTPVDVFVKAVGSAPPLAGPSATNVAFLGRSAYAQVAVGNNLKASITATGSTGPVLFQASMPTGVVADSISGTQLAGSAFTILLLPRAIAGSPAALSGTSGKVADSTITFSGTTATARFTAAPGFAANQIVNITAASDPAFNGSYVVDSTATVSRTAPGITAYYVYYTLFSTPAAAATGARVRAGGSDYTAPAAFIMVDR